MKTSMHYFLLLITGFVAGAGHVLSGPDHLAAVAPMAVDRRKNTWRVGLLWGVGHSGGVWILALAALALREALPIDLLSAWGERLVGFVLIGIGLIGLRRLFRTHIHTHVHEHDGVRHAHIHVHADNPQKQHPVAHKHSHKAFGIGMLHGLAGTAHLLGVLPALLLPTRLAAFLYVVSFGIGSIVAMTVFSWIVGLITRRMEGVGNRTYRALLGSSCAATVFVGIYWCYAAFQPAQVAP
ncbi:MAG: sulfite exporter TauE/SafE family protein [Planctomycetota bacterium]|nr:sulfite exporter TauE/SafE family protein [Planctomycetota bacterium]